MARSDARRARIRTEVERLAEFHPGIVNCHVLVEQRDRDLHDGRAFNVRIAVRIPGHEIAVTQDHHEDISVALLHAFAGVNQRIEDHVRLEAR